MPKNQLRVATCQFSVEASIAHNRRWVLHQIAHAAEQGVDVVHFSECALSGYAGVDIPNTQSIDWEELHAATRDVLKAARQHRVGVLLGSTHFLADDVKPHNSVYVINSQGQLVDRRDAAMQGRLHSGTIAEHPRSQRVTEL